MSVAQTTANTLSWFKFTPVSTALSTINKVSGSTTTLAAVVQFQGASQDVLGAGPQFPVTTDTSAVMGIASSDVVLDDDSGTSTGGPAVDTTNWWLIAISLTANTGGFAYAKNLTSGAASTTAALSTSRPSAQTSVFAAIGNLDFIDMGDAGMNVAVAGMWATAALSQTQLDSLATHKATSDWVTLSPDFLVECNTLTPTDIGVHPSTFNSQSGMSLVTDTSGWTFQAGSTDLNVSVSDSTTVTDSVALSGLTASTLNVTVSDVTTVTDTVSASITTPGTPSVNVSDSTTVTDSVSVQFQALPDLNVTVSDSTTVTDFQVIAYDPPITFTLEVDVTDSTTVTDSSSASISALADLNVNVSDATTVTDTVSATMSDLNVAVTDSTTVTDSVSVSLPAAGTLTINVSDNTTVTDTSSVGPLALSGINVTDSTTVTDSVSVRIAGEGLPHDYDLPITMAVESITRGLAVDNPHSIAVQTNTRGLAVETISRTLAVDEPHSIAVQPNIKELAVDGP